MCSPSAQAYEVLYVHTEYQGRKSRTGEDPNQERHWWQIRMQKTSKGRTANLDQEVPLAIAPPSHHVGNSNARASLDSTGTEYEERINFLPQ
jgi:hypothetical protein